MEILQINKEEQLMQDIRRYIDEAIQRLYEEDEDINHRNVVSEMEEYLVQRIVKAQKDNNQETMVKMKSILDYLKREIETATKIIDKKINEYYEEDQK